MRWVWAMAAVVAAVGCDDGERPAGDSPQVSARSTGSGPEIEVTVHRLTTPDNSRDSLTTAADLKDPLQTDSGGAAMRLTTQDHPAQPAKHHHRRHHWAIHSPESKPPWADPLQKALQQQKDEKSWRHQEQPADPYRTPDDPVPPDSTAGGG